MKEKSPKQVIEQIFVGIVLVCIIMVANNNLEFNTSGLLKLLSISLGVLFIPIIVGFFNNKAGWVVLVIMVLGYAFSTNLTLSNTSSTNLKYVFKAKNCDFSINFPSKPKVETYSDPELGDYEVALWKSEGKDSTILKSECVNVEGIQSLVQKIGTKKFILEQLSLYVKNNGLTASSYKFDDAAKQPSGTARAYKEIQGKHVTYEIKLIIGKNTLFTISTGGVSKLYPSNIIRPFMNSYEETLGK